MIRKVLRRLETLSPLRVFLLGGVVACLLGWIDVVTGEEFSLAIIYLAPISMVAWYSGAVFGGGMSVLCALLWLASNFLAGHRWGHPFFPIWDTIVRGGIFLAFSLSFARLRTALSHERLAARTDPLTGVPNMRRFLEIGTQEIERLKRYGRPFTLAYLDLDNFKTINDTHGHVAGDEILREVAASMLRHLRASDSLARLGGDEFIILLPETEEAAGRRSMERLRQQLREDMRLREWPITFSMGLITIRRSPESVSVMIQLADRLMYAAKTGGKDKIEIETYA